MDRDPAFQEWLDRQPKCEECGKPQTTLHKHYEHCSKYEHIVDDHYDSACMRGTCKHCYPDYKPKIMMEVSEDEQKLLEKLRHAGSSYGTIMYYLRKVSAYFN